MTRKSTRLEAFSFSAAAQLDGAPEWVHLLPLGKVETVDERGGFIYDGSAVALLSHDGKDQVDRVVVDCNHATSKRTHLGEDIPARGWINELAARPDGLWARVEWTELGRATLASKSYRGVSAEVFSKAGRVFGVRAVSLTNLPAVKHLTPIFLTANPNDDDGDDMNKLMLALLSTLKLKDDTSEDALVAHVTSLANDASTKALQLSALAKVVGAKETDGYDTIMLSAQAYADPTKVVPVKVVEEMRAELLSANNKYEAMNSTLRRDKATAFIEGEFKKGRIGLTDTMRKHYIERHMLSVESAAVVELEISNLPIMGADNRIAIPATKDGVVMLTVEQKKVASTLGLSDADFIAQLKADEETN